MYELNDAELDAVCGGISQNAGAAAAGGVAAIAAAANVAVKDLIDIGDITIGDITVPVAVAVLGGAVAVG